MHHVTICADIFGEVHVRRIADVVEGWASWAQIAETLSAKEKADRLTGTDIVVGWAPPEVLATSQVTHYFCGSAGYDAYRGHGLERKLTFCNAAGTMSIPIAEHALAMMFALTRQLPWHEHNRTIKEFERCRDAGEVFGSKICIAGTGGAGTELAKRCLALGMDVVGVRKDPAKTHPVIKTLFPLSELSEAVRGADHVVCLLPASPDTQHCFQTEVFAAVKSGSFFYNVSRGAPLDSDALADALARGHLAGAGLDVHDPEPLPADSPLWTHPNVLITGHSAGWSLKLADRLCDLFVENLQNLHAARPLKNVIHL